MRAIIIMYTYLLCVTMNLVTLIIAIANKLDPLFILMVIGITAACTVGWATSLVSVKEGKNGKQ